MADFSVITIENGFPLYLPGFLNDTAVSTFPFWGSFTFLDFSIMSFIYKKIPNINIIINKKYKKIIPLLLSRWKNEIRNIIVLENEKKDFLSFLKQLESKYLIISALMHIAFFNSEELIHEIEKEKSTILKISIDKFPLDIYFVKKNILIEFIESLDKDYIEEKSIHDIIFNEFLDHKFELMIDLPGSVFFNNNIMQLYQGNLWIITNMHNKLFLDLLNRTSGRITHDKGSFISEHGHIKNSYLSPGVEIDGYIENSVIFPDVIVKKKANVLNSVIMNNNIIGTNTHIQNALIFPFYGESTNNFHNIGDNSVIGGKTSIVRNKNFPDQIYNGLAVLGTNTQIPRGFRIEQSSYLGPYITAKQLKQLKILKKGVSLYSKMMENNEK